MQKVRGGLLGAAVVEFALLAATGLYLAFYYEPDSAFGWFGYAPPHRPPTDRVVEAVRVGHRVTALALVVTVIALAAVVIFPSAARSIRSFRSRGHGVTVVAAVGLAVFGLFASFTGYLLPWDQLQLSAVTIGGSLKGFGPFFRHSSRIHAVYVGHSAVAVTTIRTWFLLHVLVVPVVMVVLGAVVVRRRDQPDGHTGLG